MIYENFLLCTGSCDSQWLAAKSSYAKQKKANNICHFVMSNLTLLHGFCLATNILQKEEDPVNKIILPKKEGSLSIQQNLLDGMVVVTNQAV